MGKTIDQSSGIVKRRVFCAKTDVRSAFRLVPGSPQSWPCQIMKAKDPCTGKTFFFIDKCLAFGASISCAVFQKFSNALRHLIEYNTGRKMSVCAYLDDYMFVAEMEHTCNLMVSRFMDMCSYLGIPIAVEKTDWASTRIVFLGILILGDQLLLSIPEVKRLKALNMAKNLIQQRTATVLELQRFVGYLNFLCKAIFPGRAFTRRMYAKFYPKQLVLKPYHHMSLDAEFKGDCEMWVQFLNTPESYVVCRPFVDIDGCLDVQQLQFYTNASASAVHGGFGGTFSNQWFASKWEEGFIQEFNPCIEFLELYALCMGVFIWTPQLANSRVRVYCDNTTVWDQLESMASSCKYCMKLIRTLVLHGMKHNFQVFARYIESAKNDRADHLSCLWIQKFFQITPNAKVT